MSRVYVGAADPSEVGARHAVPVRASQDDFDSARPDAESFAALVTQIVASSATPIAALCGPRFISDPRCNSRRSAPTRSRRLSGSVLHQLHLPVHASSPQAAPVQNPHTNCRFARDRPASGSRRTPPLPASSAHGSQPPNCAVHPAGLASRIRIPSRASESAAPFPTGPGTPAKTPPAPRSQASPAVRSPESSAHTDSKSDNPPAQKSAPQFSQQKPSADQQPCHRDRLPFFRRCRCGSVQTHQCALSHPHRIEKERKQSGVEPLPEWSKAHDPCAPAPLRLINATARPSCCLTQLKSINCPAAASCLESVHLRNAYRHILKGL